MRLRSSVNVLKILNFNIDLMKLSALFLRYQQALVSSSSSVAHQNESF